MTSARNSKSAFPIALDQLTIGGDGWCDIHG